MTETLENRKCWVCGVEGDQSRLVYGPPGLAMCFRCITDFDPSADLTFSGVCPFCEHHIGQTRGWFRRRRVRASVVSGGSAMCNDCLQLMRDIVEEETWHDPAI
jgi:hypothetical protein